MAVGADGSVWIACGDGTHSVMRLDRGRWRPVGVALGSALNGATFFSAPNGTMWVLGSGGTFYSRGGSGQLTTATTSTHFGSNLMMDAKGALWLMGTGGVSRFPAFDRGNTGSLEQTNPKLPKYKWITSTVDRSGRIWGTTVVSGIFSFAPGARDVDIIGENRGLTSDRAAAILADRDGNVWVGTERGLDRFSPATIFEEDTIPRNPEDGFGLTAGAKGIFLSDGHNVWKIAGAQLPEIIAKPPSTESALCGNDAAVWMGDARSGWMIGLAGSASGRRIRLPPNVRHDVACAVDRADDLWISATGLGIAKRVGDRWQPYRLPMTAASSQALTIDNENRPVVIIDRQNIVRLSAGRWDVWAGARIGFERPTAFSSGAGDLVVGGLTGLLRIHEQRAAKLDFENHPWLRDIKAIVATSDRSTWLLGHKGIFRVGTATLERAFDDPYRPIPHETFDQDDGRVTLPQRYLGMQGAEDAAGRIWFLTRQSVLYAPPAVGARKLPPIALSIRDLDAGGKRYSADRTTTLPAGTTSLTVNYGALDLSTANQRRYRTRLDSVDSGWTDAGDRHQATYLNLRPGQYRFSVETTDRRGVWQQPGATTTFTIAPFFYQATWFKLALLVIACMSVFIAYRRRLHGVADRTRRVIEAQVAERERIARELHDTLLQGMQGLMLRFQAVAERMPPGAPARQMMDDALERGDDVILEGRDRVLDLRVAAAPVDLEGKLGSLVELAGGVPLEIEVLGAPRAVCSPVVQEIAAIAAEAISNAVRHANATRIELTISHGKRDLVVTIRDDGVGIDPVIAREGHRAGHFGLVGMRERADTLNAKLKIETGPSQGTLIRITIPVGVAYRETLGRWRLW